MDEAFINLLGALTAPNAVRCRHRFSASFIDEDEYVQLGALYESALTTLTSQFGAPLDPIPQVNEPIDVESLACWQRPTGIAFVMLWWGDNTRIRVFEIGIVVPGTMLTVIEPPPNENVNDGPSLAERMQQAWQKTYPATTGQHSVEPP